MLVILCCISVSLYYVYQQKSIEGIIISMPEIMDVGTVHEETIVVQQELPIEKPIRLKIPSIGVDASIEHVGLTFDGAMGVPTNPESVAWFNLGPRPGELGSAVLAGHVDWIDTSSAVFEALHTLREGDVIYVEDDQGATRTFIVQKTVLYDKDDDAMDVFYSSDGISHLNLITCAGGWDPVQQTYKERFIVFADRA